MDHFDPRAHFPEFYQNPTIQALAINPRWTVSGQLGDDISTHDIKTRKAPIDIRELKKNGRVRGAFEKSPTCLMTLAEILDFLPNVANHALAINAHIDEVMVLDIEKTCPPEVARELLALPSLYSEVSMSHQGYHLVMPIPANFEDFPLVRNKVALGEEHGWYEILIDHWITFTRIPVPPERLLDDEGQAVTAGRTWEEVFAALADRATEIHIDAETRRSVSLDKPEIPGEVAALHVMTSRPFSKTLEHFHGDHSRYEFSILGALLKRLTPALPFLSQEYSTQYDASMKAWLLYEAAREVIPHRAKHDELRNQMPLLLNAATDLLARREGAQRQQGAG